MTIERLDISTYYAKKEHTHAPNDITYGDNKHLSDYIKETNESNGTATYSILLSPTNSTNPVSNNCFEMAQYSNNKRIYASVKKNGVIQEEGFVVFIANGETYTRQIGGDNIPKFAVLDIIWDMVHRYSVFAVYIGNPAGITSSKASSYAYCMNYCLVDIVPEYVLTTKDADITYGTDGAFTATLTQRNTNKTPLTNKPIIFRINGVSYVRTTDASGTASLNIKLPPGTYPITTIYEYTVDNNTRTIENTDTVKVKTNYILSTNDLISKIDETGKFEAELTKKDGTKISNKDIFFTIHELTYKRKTGTNGIATMNINLGYNANTGTLGTPGTYPISTTCEISEDGRTYTLTNNNTVIRYNPDTTQ